MSPSVLRQDEGTRQSSNSFISNIRWEHARDLQTGHSAQFILTLTVSVASAQVPVWRLQNYDFHSNRASKRHHSVES